MKSFCLALILFFSGLIMPGIVQAEIITDELPKSNNPWIIKPEVAKELKISVSEYRYQARNLNRKGNSGPQVPEGVPEILVELSRIKNSKFIATDY